MDVGGLTDQHHAAEKAAILENIVLATLMTFIQPAAIGGESGLDAAHGFAHGFGLSASLGLLMPTLAQSGTPAAPEPSTSGHSVLQYVTAGGFIGYVIIMLSILGLGLAIAHFMQVRRERMTPPQAVDDLARLFRDNDMASAFQYCAQPANDSFLTRVFHTALRRCGTSPFGMLELRTAIEEAGSREVDRLHRSTDAIGLIAAVGPMLGLLGTVFGMIGAFGAIGDNEGASRSKELAGYMSLALVTTAQGLVVAIPANAAYQFFKRRIDRLASEAGDVIEQLVGVVEQSSGAPRPQAALRPRPVAGPIAGQGPGAVGGQAGGQVGGQAGGAGYSQPGVGAARP